MGMQHAHGWQRGRGRRHLTGTAASCLGGSPAGLLRACTFLGVGLGQISVRGLLQAGCRQETAAANRQHAGAGGPSCAMCASLTRNGGELLLCLSPCVGCLRRGHWLRPSARPCAPKRMEHQIDPKNAMRWHYKSGKCQERSPEGGRKNARERRQCRMLSLLLLTCRASLQTQPGHQSILQLPERAQQCMQKSGGAL